MSDPDISRCRAEIQSLFIEQLAKLGSLKQLIPILASLHENPIASMHVLGCIGAQCMLAGRDDTAFEGVAVVGGASGSTDEPGSLAELGQPVVVIFPIRPGSRAASWPTEALERCRKQLEEV